MGIPILSAINTAIDKIVPDANKRIEFKLKAKELDQKGQFKGLEIQLQRDLGQIEINKEDAKSNSKFQSWWRPAAAWVCVLGLAYVPFTALLEWFITVIAWISDKPLDDFPRPPVINTEALVTLLVGMLGLAVKRTTEKHLRHTKWRDKNKVMDDIGDGE